MPVRPFRTLVDVRQHTDFTSDLYTHGCLLRLPVCEAFLILASSLIFFFSLLRKLSGRGTLSANETSHAANRHVQFSSSRQRQTFEPIHTALFAFILAFVLLFYPGVACFPSQPSAPTASYR